MQLEVNPSLVVEGTVVPCAQCVFKIRCFLDDVEPIINKLSLGLRKTYCNCSFGKLLNQIEQVSRRLVLVGMLVVMALVVSFLTSWRYFSSTAVTICLMRAYWTSKDSLKTRKFSQWSSLRRIASCCAVPTGICNAPG